MNEVDYSIKADKGKFRPTLVPLKLIEAVARIRGFGVSKYGDSDSWKRVEVQRYRDAMYRHLLKYLADPYGVDEESWLPHLWHCVCNGAFLIDIEWEEDVCSAKKQTASEIEGRNV